METVGGASQPLKSITGANMAVSIPEDFFARGKAFTHQDYHTMTAAQVMDFIFDPTAYAPPPGALNRIVGFFPSIFAEAGPILMDIFYDVDESGDGVTQGIFNRDSTSPNVASSILRLDPTTITNPGTRFTGIGIPANATGAGQQVSSSVEDQLPFALDTTKKYLIRLTNQNGNDTLVTMRFTFFEI